MTTATPEVIPADPDQLELPFEFEDFDIPCEVGLYWPELPVTHGPAEWIGHKSCGCPARLLCDVCHEQYVDLAAHWATFQCMRCGVSNTFNSFERLERSKS